MLHCYYLASVFCFVQRICENSQGVINFCLFCLFEKEVKSATVNAIKQLCHCPTTTTPMPDFTWLTPPDISNTEYGATNTRK